MALPQIAPRRPLPSPGLFSPERLTPALLALVAIGLGALIAHDVFFPPATPLAAIRTANVTVGTVRAAVTGTGSLVPSTQQSLGFRSSGTLTEVDVKVGDHVTAGQVLAKIDPGPLQLSLQQAQASLAAAQANLSNTLSGTQLTQAADQLRQAQQSYSDTVAQVNQTNNLDQTAVNSDQSQLNVDQGQLSADQGNYWYQQYQPTLSTAQSLLLTGQQLFQANSCSPTDPSPTGNCLTAKNDIPQAQATISCLQLGGATCTPAEQQIATAYKAVQGDQAKVSADSSKLSADQTKQSIDQQSGQRSVNQAQNSITSAQDAYNSQAVNRPATIAQQQAAVAAAQAQVNTAQSNLDGAVLVAPIPGVVSSVSGVPGDVVGALNASSGAQAPGTTALLPTSSGGTGTGNTGSSSASSSGFIGLFNDKAYQAIVQFAESDAAKIQAGQAGTVTFDALPNVSVPIHVLAVAAAPTVSSNVVNYYVTLTLDRIDSQLKAGLTTNASIVTSSASNVLTVPNSALTRLGGASFVNVLGRDGKEVRTRVTTGVVGDSTTEITQGLSAGDKVVLPQLRTTTGTTNRAGAGGGGFGGGGGIRVGGGG